MPVTHPITVLAFGLLAAVAVASVSYLASAPDVPTADAAPGFAGAVATPNHDPLNARLAQPPAAEAVATPNHDSHRALPVLALNPVTLRAALEPAASPAPALAPTFVSADTTLYAKDSARLRAAPSTSADVLTSLTVDTALRAVARSSDGAWWQVSLAGGRSGYIHRTAVTQVRTAKTTTSAPTPASAPVTAAVAPQPAPPPRRQGLMGYVDETMDWLADTARRGSAPAAIHTER
jgi:uncharacterized protein YgiM (DUF1202 family)